MSGVQTHTEKTAADGTIVGFDYQYYYFLFKLLSLKKGETVGFEVKDDVHTDLDCENQVLIQLKHTVQQKKDVSQSINLSTLDNDLWHTLFNWCKVITDEVALRTTLAKQEEFINKTIFVLASNKTENTSNKFLGLVDKFHRGQKSIIDTRQEIEKIRASTTNEKIQEYIDEVLKFSNQLLELFLKKLRFDLGQDDLIEKCKDCLIEKMVDDSHIDNLFRQLDSRIKEEIYIKMKSGQKVVIKFEDFHSKYRKYFQLARNKLVVKEFDGNLPDNLEEQIFIKQLLDIDDFKDDDYDRIIELTKHQLQLRNHLESWLQEGDVIQEELDAFDEETITIWKNKYTSIYRRPIPNPEQNTKALEIVDAMREKQLFIASEPLDTKMSNGQFYRLSNQPLIGWLKDWKEKYE